MFPVPFAQQRLWLIGKLEPCVPLYNVARALRLTGDLDVEALQRALCELVRQHEVLRTHFDTERGKPLQMIRGENGIALDVEALDTLSEDSREEEARRRLCNEWAVPFDLQRGPLFRCRLLRLGPNDHWLLLTWHHIVADAWSEWKLRSEVSALYSAFHRGQPSPLSALRLQYGEYVLCQRELLQGEMLAEQVAYWTSALAGLQVLEFHVSSEGLQDGRLQRREFVRAYRPLELAGAMQTAIAWTTSASVVAVIELVRDGVLPQQGFLKQEEIPLDKFLLTGTGRLFGA